MPSVDPPAIPMAAGGNSAIVSPGSLVLNCVLDGEAHGGSQGLIGRSETPKDTRGISPYISIPPRVASDVLPVRRALGVTASRAIPKWGSPMNEETLNLSIRSFLKTVGVNSQRAIEHAVAAAVTAGSIAGTETFPAKMTLEIGGLKLNVVFNGDITLQ